MARRQLVGRTYGLKTSRGIALMQIVQAPDPTDLRLTRICNGFLPEDYSEGDILEILNRKEMFFMYTCLGFSNKHRLYKEFFVFDKVYDVPADVQLPQAFRAYWPDSKDEGRWYYRETDSSERHYVGSDPSQLTDEFLALPPDTTWSFLRIIAFLESGKQMKDELY